MAAGCGDAPVEQERFAFLAPDNQTGDSSLDWTTIVIHRGLSAAVGVSVAADTIADARAAGVANRFVYSTLTKAESPGEVRLHSELFDPAGQKFVREFTVTGDPLQVINRMAANLTTEPYALGVKSEEELRRWPVFAGDVNDFEAKCLEVAGAEPAFGPAISGCLDQLTTAAQLDRVRELLGRVPSDKYADFSPEVQFSFGQAYMALKDYAKAVGLYKLAGATRPGVKNLLGYAEAMTGDCDGAKKALEEYSTIPSEEANGLDSLGEVSYFCGQYKEAEQYFTQSGPKWKTEQGQLEPVKAAAARLMAGDPKGADQIAAAHFQKISKSDPRATAALQPVWKAIASATTVEERKARIESTLIRRP
jgi:tetratricopeptide (TPR) repeat protein